MESDKQKFGMRMYKDKETGAILDFGEKFKIVWDFVSSEKNKDHMSEAQYTEVRFEELSLPQAIAELESKGVEIDYKALLDMACTEYSRNEELLKRHREDDQRMRDLAHDRGAYNDRVEILHCMEKLMRLCNNEDLIEGWLMCGVPDGANEEDYQDIAKSRQLYEDAVKTFLRAMRRTYDIDDYWPYLHWGKKKDAYGTHPAERTDTDIFHNPLGNRVVIELTVEDEYNNVIDDDINSCIADDDRLAKLCEVIREWNIETEKKLRENKTRRE